MNKQLCVIYGPIETYSGYGSHARDIAKSFIALKGSEWDIKIVSCPWGNTSNGFIDDNEEEWGFLKNYILNNPIDRQPDFMFWITVPNEAQPVGKYNVLITAGIETTMCDPSWIEGCNRMQEVWVSSEHSKKVFENSKYEKRDKNTNQIAGVIELSNTVKLKVIPEGCDVNVYKPSITNIELNGVKENFLFLFCGHWLQGSVGQDRKDIGMLIKVFLETFKNKNNPPALVLKTSMGNSSIMDKEGILKKIDDIRKTVKGVLPNIYLFHGNVSDEEINGLYNHPKIKAMVSFTKGEGFGRPLLEFSMVEKPIIVSGWSGHLDFIKPEFNIVLPGKLEQIDHSAVVPNMLLKESQWFTADYVVAGQALQEVYKEYKKYKILAKKQAKHSKDNFSFEALDKILKIHLGEISKNVPRFVDLQLPKISLPKLTKVKI